MRIKIDSLRARIAELEHELAEAKEMAAASPMKWTAYDVKVYGQQSAMIASLRAELEEAKDRSGRLENELRRS